MNQSANIAASITTLFRTNDTLPGLVPGSLLYGDLKAGTERPYAMLDVSLIGGPDYMTGEIYVQQYEVTIRVWASQALGDSSDIQEALETLMGANTKMTLLKNNAWTLHVSLEPEGLEEDAERELGTNIFIAGARWVIQLQEQRRSI